MSKELKIYTASLDIEIFFKGNSQREALTYGAKNAKKLGFEVTNISAREDYDNSSQLIIEMTLEGSKSAKGTGSIIDSILLDCKKLKLEVTRINCYEE
tara:strand:- start:353 stop:646 length:294 start_codon:yes stop_codon:yes gene_type:complete